MRKNNTIKITKEEAEIILVCLSLCIKDVELWTDIPMFLRKMCKSTISDLMTYQVPPFKLGDPLDYATEITTDTDVLCELLTYTSNSLHETWKMWYKGFFPDVSDNTLERVWEGYRLKMVEVLQNLQRQTDYKLKKEITEDPTPFPTEEEGDWPFDPVVGQRLIIKRVVIPGEDPTTYYRVVANVQKETFILVFTEPIEGLNRIAFPPYDWHNMQFDRAES